MNRKEAEVGRHSRWHGLLIAGALALASAQTVQAAPVPGVTVPQVSVPSVPQVSAPGTAGVGSAGSVPQVSAPRYRRCPCRRWFARCRAAGGHQSALEHAGAHAGAAARGHAERGTPAPAPLPAGARALRLPAASPHDLPVTARRGPGARGGRPRDLLQAPASAAEAARGLRRQARAAAGARARPAGRSARLQAADAARARDNTGHVARPHRPHRAAWAGQSAPSGPCRGLHDPGVERRSAWNVWGRWDVREARRGPGGCARPERRRKGRGIGWRSRASPSRSRRIRWSTASRARGRDALATIGYPARSYIREHPLTLVLALLATGLCGVLFARELRRPQPS